MSARLGWPTLPGSSTRVGALAVVLVRPSSGRWFPRSGSDALESPKSILLDAIVRIALRKFCSLTHAFFRVTRQIYAANKPFPFEEFRSRPETGMVHPFPGDWDHDAKLLLGRSRSYDHTLKSQLCKVNLCKQRRVPRRTQERRHA